MGYADFVQATPEPQLAFLLNVILPGLGCKAAAYYGDGGVNWKCWAIGMLMNIIWCSSMFSAAWWYSWTFWLPIIPACLWFLAFIIWAWAVFHSYLIWKVSREKYYST